VCVKRKKAGAVLKPSRFSANHNSINKPQLFKPK
jgi:hypothetical protein